MCWLRASGPPHSQRGNRSCSHHVPRDAGLTFRPPDPRRGTPGSRSFPLGGKKGKTRTRHRASSTTTNAPATKSAPCRRNAVITIGPKRLMAHPVEPPSPAVATLHTPMLRRYRRAQGGGTHQDLVPAAPAASRPMTVPTVTRIPRIHALPPMTAGSRVIRESWFMASFLVSIHHPNRRHHPSQLRLFQVTGLFSPWRQASARGRTRVSFSAQTRRRKPIRAR